MVTEYYRKNCPLCNGSSTSGVAAYDHRTIVQCSDCKFHFASQYDLAQLEHYYRKDYYKSADDPRIQEWIGEHMIVWRGLAEQLRKKCSTIGKFLDVGAGTGGFLIALREQFPDADFHGVESSPEAREHLEREFSTIQLPAAAAEDISKIPYTYDCITLLQCLEHVNNPAQLCRDIFDRLKPGGIFLVTVPNCHSYEVLSGKKKKSQCYGNVTHLQFFSSTTLKRMLTDAGFEGQCRVAQYEDYGDGFLRGSVRFFLRKMAVSTELRVIAYK